MSSSLLPALGLVDAQGASRQETWADLDEAMKHVNAFVGSIGGRFFERHLLLEKLKFALCMGEHLLLSGPGGAAKTNVVEDVIGGIRDAVIWSSDLSRGMSEVQVFGDFDAKEAQETGILKHRTEGSLLEAHFINLGEFFDANTPLLRALLRVLNERQFHRGAQKLDLPLLTAVANTNASPAELLAVDKNDTLGAVIDRFLFHQKVEFLAERENRRGMLRQRAGIRKRPPVIPVSLRHIALIVDCIEQLNFILEDGLVCAYEEVAFEFAKARGRAVSDRRLNKGIDLLEAASILRGSREGVTWDDLPIVGLMLVDDPRDRPKFDEIVRAVVERGRDQDANDAETNERANVDLLVGSVTVFKPEEVALVPETDLVRARREALKAIGALRRFVPATPSVKDHKRAQLDTLEGYATLLQEQIDSTGSDT